MSTDEAIVSGFPKPVAKAKAANVFDAAEAAGAAAPRVEAVGIVKRWPSMNRPVLDDVGLVIQPGAAVHIGGRNGVGKTTLLRILTGLISPDSGTVALDGLRPDKDRVTFQRSLAFLSAGDRALYNRLTVRRHLDFWARLSFVPRSERRAVVDRAIDRYDLHELAGRRVDRMSMGQRQRLRLAGLLLHDPKVAVVDEPRNSLDDEGIALMVAGFRDLVGRGGALIWCSPAGDRTDFHFDDAYELNDGRLHTA